MENNIVLLLDELKGEGVMHPRVTDFLKREVRSRRKDINTARRCMISGIYRLRNSINACKFRMDQTGREIFEKIVQAELAVPVTEISKAALFLKLVFPRA